MAMYVSDNQSRWFIPEFIEPEKRTEQNSFKHFEESVKTEGRLWKTYRFPDGALCRVFAFRNIVAPCGVCGQPSLSKSLLIGVDEKGLISGYWKKCERCQALLDAKEAGISYTADDMAVMALREARVYEKDLNRRFENFRPQEIARGADIVNRVKGFAYTREYGEKETNALALIGRTGTGKTHLAISAMYTYLRHNNSKKGRYVEQSAMMEEIRASYNKGGEATHVKASFGAYDILVIDEIGRIQSTANNQNFLQEIVQKRIDQGLKTILCGNVDPAELEEVLGKQNASRFKAAGEALYLDGQDFRAKYGKL